MRVPAYASPDIGIPRKVVMRRLVLLGLLKRKVPIQGDRRPAIARRGVATVRTRRRQVFATALADWGSWLPRLLEMNRVAAVGRASCVRVVKIAIVAVRSDIWPMSARLRIRKRRM